MALVNQNLYLEITPGTIPPILNVTEYDENMQVVVHLRERGQAYEIPSGVTAKVEGTLTGHPFRVDATPASGEDTVTFELSEAMTGYAGRAWTKLKLVKDNKPVHTCGFWLNCDRAGVEAGDVVAMTGFEQQLKDGVYDYLDDKHIPDYVPIDMIDGGNRVNKTEDGIEFVWYPDKKACWLDGTNTNPDAPAAQYFAGSAESLPDGIEAGNKYFVTVKTTSANAGLGFYFFKNEEYYDGQYFITNGQLDVPEDAEGMLAFVGVWSGQTVYHDVVSNIGLFRYETNQMLSDRITNVSQFVKESLLDGSYPIYFENKRLTSLSDQTYVSALKQISSDPMYFDNRFLKITVDSGYSATVYYRNEQETVTSRAMSEGSHFFYAGSNIPVVFSLAKTSAGFVTPSDGTHLTVKELDPEATTPLGSGIVQHPLAWERGAGISYAALHYGAEENFWASAPIKLPKSGLRIGYTPECHARTYTYDANGTWSFKYPSFKVTVVKAGNNGLSAQTEDADLLAVCKSAAHNRYSVYVPYVADCYAIVTIYTGSAVQGADYSDLLYASSGEVERGYCGVYNLFPTPLWITTAMDGFEGQNALDIKGVETLAYTYSSAMYYGTLLRLRDVNRIVCSPKYTLLAEIFKTNADGTVTRHSDVYGAWPPDGNPAGGTYATSGVSAIDFSAYDFDGFALVAIQATSEYKADSENTYSIRLDTMGGMARYEDVIEKVCVEYKPGVNIAYVPGMPSLIAENIHQLMNWTVPEYGAGKYVEQGDDEAHLFPAMQDASVAAMYGGTYLANTLLMQVTAKSAMTCIKNRNGRMRKMQRVETDQPGTDGVPINGNIAYGVTCTNFCSVLMGLKENYTSWAYAYQDKRKFDHYEFDYQYDLDKLRPGDVLTKYIAIATGDRYTDSHCRMVESIVTVNGVVRAVNVIEAWYPFNRRMTFVDESYCETGSKIINAFDLRGLADYVHINRIKPEYIKPIRETFGVFPNSSNVTVGKVMCDRGADSIYGIHTNYVELSFNNADVDEYLYLFKNGSKVADIPKSMATEVNGLMLLNAVQFLDGEGLYTVKTDQSDAVQETFYVKGDVTPVVRTASGDDVILTVADMEHFVWMELWYGSTASAEEMAQRKSPTHVKEEFAISGDIGTITVPNVIDGKTLYGINCVYDTPYGTYWADNAGRVSSDYYGLD